MEELNSTKLSLDEDGLPILSPTSSIRKFPDTIQQQINEFSPTNRDLTLPSQEVKPKRFPSLINTPGGSLFQQSLQSPI